MLLDCNLHPSSCEGRAEQRGKAGGISLKTIDLLEKANLFCVFLRGEGFFSWLLNLHTLWVPWPAHLFLSPNDPTLKSRKVKVKFLKSQKKNQKNPQATKPTPTTKPNAKNPKQPNPELTVYLKNKWELVCWTLHLNSLFPWSWVLCSCVIFSSGESTCTLLGRPAFTAPASYFFLLPRLLWKNQACCLFLFWIYIHMYVLVCSFQAPKCK